MQASKEGIAYKNSLYQQLAIIGKSLSASRRLEIMDLLAQGPKTVDKLAKISGMSVANTSRHLQVLLKANLVKNKKEKNFVIYALASKEVQDMFYLLRNVGEAQLPRMKSLREDFLHEEKVKPISLDQARKMVYDPQTHIIDLRDPDEFAQGHLPGAINVPVSQLEKTLNQFSSDDRLILYCRGHLCSYADEATHYLRKKGIEAYSLHETYNDWHYAQNK